LAESDEINLVMNSEIAFIIFRKFTARFPDRDLGDPLPYELNKIIDDLNKDVKNNVHNLEVLVTIYATLGWKTSLMRYQ
jgi:hypothetical protein